MKIAVLIPSYQSAKTIVATIRSIGAQTALNRLSGVYLADDCSTDNSISLVSGEWKYSIPLHVISSQMNMGERGNVNNALAQLSGSVDWVLILHSDDLAKTNWLEIMCSRIERSQENVGSICSSWDVLLPEGSAMPGEDNSQRGIELIVGESGAVVGTLKRGCWWHISGCAIRLRAFESIGGFNPNMPQLGDWEWLLRCLAKGWAVEYIPKSLILYRQHEQSISANSFANDRDVLESLAIVRQHLPLLSGPELIRFHSLRLHFMARRLARAAISFRLDRCFRVVGNAWRVVKSLISCLVERRVPNDRRAVAGIFGR